MFYDRFVQLCNLKGVSRTRACTDCGVSRTAWHKWEDGAIPNGETLNKIAAYFGVSTDYLLGKEKAPTEKGGHIVELDDVEFALYGGFSELTDDDKVTVLDMVRVMRERRKNKGGL